MQCRVRLDRQSCKTCVGPVASFHRPAGRAYSRNRVAMLTSPNNQITVFQCLVVLVIVGGQSPRARALTLMLMSWTPKPLRAGRTAGARLRRHRIWFSRLALRKASVGRWYCKELRLERLTCITCCRCWTNQISGDIGSPVLPRRQASIALKDAAGRLRSCLCSRPILPARSWAER